MWTTHQEVEAEVKCPIFPPETSPPEFPSFTFPKPCLSCPAADQALASLCSLELHGPGLALGHGRAEGAGEDSSVTL